MKKPLSLRNHLLAAVPGLSRNREQLKIFVDGGSIRSTAAAGLSFEYSYTVKLLLTDYPGSADAVAIPLLAWVRQHQSELLANQNKHAESIKFEVEILNNDLADMSISLPLTERVIVKQQAGGQLQVSHPAEPALTEGLPAGPWQLYAGDELIAEWSSSDPAGALLKTPHPPKPARHGCC